jgi:hypothetical protein
VDARKNPVIYKLKDLMGADIKGSFQKEELVLANPPKANDTFIIRKIGKKSKKIKGVEHVYVDYLFYPK